MEDPTDKVNLFYFKLFIYNIYVVLFSWLKGNLKQLKSNENIT